MYFSDKFISATENYCKLDSKISAPFFRKAFTYENEMNCELTISGLGFYELYINGINITKGAFSPYISNSNDIVYYDNYIITPYLTQGKNIIGVLLGNGMQNSYGGFVWDFDKTPYRSAPKLSLALEIDNKLIFEADELFKTHPSPILEDDLRLGETYNANNEVSGWNLPDFDDSNWSNALICSSPAGEKRLCTAKPIKPVKELKPVSIYKEEDGYIYDFGVNLSGITRLTIDGQKGQVISMTFGENIKNNKFDWHNISFIRPEYKDMRPYRQEVTYICKGDHNETYQQTFTYHGFQYVRVTGITEQQATKSLLTFVVLNTDLEKIGDFSTSDQTLTAIYNMSMNSTISNFHHFPTDCPHREKNGWTADAALSAEQTLLNWDAEVNYKEWMRNICKSQNEDGALPGIVPTWGWGFQWGNGPAWDCVLTTIPYLVYQYRGDREIVQICKDAIIKYLNYINTKKDARGLIEIGLGDWVDPTSEPPKAPLVLTDSIMTLEIARQAWVMFTQVGFLKEAEFCKGFFLDMQSSIRLYLFDKQTNTFFGNCQTSQAMGIYYDILTAEEKKKAFKALVNIIHSDDDYITTGVLGLKVIFHVLSDFGEEELAYKMITQGDQPFYGYWAKNGNTTLEENMSHADSKNHHFMSDVCAWFVKSICGINYNPQCNDLNNIAIKPHFISKIDSAKASYNSPIGKIRTYYYRAGNKISLNLELPESAKTKVILPDSWVNILGQKEFQAASGEYTIIKV